MDVREKLVELLNQIIDGGFKWSSHLYESGEQLNTDEIASHLIAHGVTVQEWISVKDRLPEDDLTEKERMERKQIRCILSDGKRVFTGSRQRYDTNQKWHWNRYSPTFWMYFPEPPKGD